MSSPWTIVCAGRVARDRVRVLEGEHAAAGGVGAGALDLLLARAVARAARRRSRACACRPRRTWSSPGRRRAGGRHVGEGVVDARRPSRRGRAARGSRRTGASPSSRRAASRRRRAPRAAPGRAASIGGPVEHPQVRLVGVARLDQRRAAERRRRLAAAVGPGTTGKRPNSSSTSAVGRHVVEVADEERAAARARPAALAEGDDRVARERAQVLLGAEHGAPERVVAERRAVDQLLGDDRRLVLVALDLLDHDAALAVELLGVDLRAPDEVGQQVDRLADRPRRGTVMWKATRSCDV